MNRFILWRILGNDLCPRHSDKQTEDNLIFILNEEPKFEDCTKSFILNRILDPKKVELYKDMISAAGCTFHEIPFVPEEYKALMYSSNSLASAHYITNVNPARNTCLTLGFQQKYQYVLPFDGGSAFREDGWEGFVNLVNLNSTDGFYLLPQWRVDSYKDALELTRVPQLKETYFMDRGTQVTGMREYTVAFSNLADYWFNPDLPYPVGDKVWLLWKLNVAGVWDRWHPEVRAEARKNMSRWAGKIKSGGFVCRLPSGNPMSDKSNMHRGKTRNEGILKIIAQADRLVT